MGFEDELKEIKDKEIFFVTPEVKSFKARAGGLGPAVEELALTLSELGLENVNVITPLYHRFFKGDEFKELEYKFDHKDLGEISFQVAGEETTTKLRKTTFRKTDFYFLENEEYAETLYYGDDFNFSIFLGKGSLELLKKLDKQPDVLHLNDPLTSLAGFYLRTSPEYSALFPNTKIVYTIHNLGRGYQQTYLPERFDELGVNRKHFYGISTNGELNFAYAGIFHSDIYNTVSTDYKLTIETQGLGLKEIVNRKKMLGITNGVDVGFWRMPYLDEGFRKEDLFKAKRRAKEELIKAIKKKTGKELNKDELLVVSPRRLAWQKGYDKMIPNVRELYEEDRKIQFIFLGVMPPDSPEGKQLKEILEGLHEKHERFVFIHEFNEDLAKKMYWGGDLLVYPSKPNYEPCGTGYMMAAVNGTPVLGTRTGGMAEEVNEFNRFSKKGNGFIVWKREYGKQAYWRELNMILDIYYNHPESWKQVCWNATKMDVDIKRAAKEYALRIYKKL